MIFTRSLKTPKERREALENHITTGHSVPNEIKTKRFVYYFLARAYTTFKLIHAHNNSYLAYSLVAFSRSAKPKVSLQLLFLGQKKMAENSKGLCPDSLQTAQISDLGPAKIFRCRGLKEMRRVVVS